VLTYVVLGTFTDQGRRTIRESPRRLDAAQAALTKIGGKMTGFYLTMGSYDFVIVMEVTDDETAAKFTLALAAQGNVRTTTLKAFPEAEYRRLIKGPR
jgi:uncharacterized protein with GYD domain